MTRESQQVLNGESNGMSGITGVFCRDGGILQHCSYIHSMKYELLVIKAWHFAFLKGHREKQTLLKFRHLQPNLQSVDLVHCPITSPDLCHQRAFRLWSWKGGRNKSGYMWANRPLSTDFIYTIGTSGFQWTFLRNSSACRYLTNPDRDHVLNLRSIFFLWNGHIMEIN